jgi:hypothetical protein
MREIWLLFLDLPNGVSEILDGKLWVVVGEYVNGICLTITYVIYGLAGENVTHRLLDPFLVSLGHSRMPPVQTIELQ